MNLRQYQQDAVSALFRSFETEHGNPLIVAPTGSGKTHIIAHFVMGVFALCPDARVMIVSHRSELLEQNEQKLRAAWPAAPASLYSASLKSKRINKITIAGIQSIYKHAKKVAPVDILLIDECHLVPDAGNGLYRRFIKDLLAENQYMKIVGLTATPYRMTSGKLTEGHDRIFTDVAYDISVRRLLDEGWLAPLVGKTSVHQGDMSNIAIRAGEFVQRDIEREFSNLTLINHALDEVFKLAGDRRSWLFFCAGVNHAQLVADALNARGKLTFTVTGETLGLERAHYLSEFKRGQCAITNCDVLTTGFDAPNIDLIVLLRPTRSTSLYCFDLETEVLTNEGWKKQDELTGKELLAAPDPTTLAVSWTPILSQVIRKPYPEESVYSYESPRLSFCVSDNHRMIWKSKKFDRSLSDFKIGIAKELYEKPSEYYLPTAASFPFRGCRLSDSELAFIGWVMSDGTINKTNRAIVISQSERYKDNITHIEQTLIGCGFKFGHLVRTLPTNYSKNPKPMHLFTISHGKPRGRDSHLRGWADLQDYISREFAQKLLSEMTVEQFEIVLDALNRGNGSKPSPNSNWVQQSFSIASGCRTFSENLQIASILRGYSANISIQSKGRAKPLFMIHIKKRTLSHIGGSSYPDRPTMSSLDEKPAKLWCVENEIGTLITRRHGKVLITGNCQMMGRGMRLCDGKTDCLVLDYAGNIERHGPVDDIRIKTSKGDSDSEAEPPAKTCPNCRLTVAPRTIECPECGYEFPASMLSHESVATEATPLKSADESAVRALKVYSTDYSYHRTTKEGSRDTMKAIYTTGDGGVVREWICIEHEGYARRKAEKWWQERARPGYEECPETIEDAVYAAPDALRTVTKIFVKKENGFDRILSYHYVSEAQQVEWDEMEMLL